jgi:signal transduction histidine kinase
VLDERGQSVGAVLTVRDVTEQRAREEERERLLSERDRAVTELEQAMRSRSRFYASMSHELRTPINAIIGYNDLLRSGVYGDVPDEQQVALDRVSRAAGHLLELINDVLDLSKLEAGKLTIQPEPVLISDVISDLRATMQPLADEHGAELRIAVENACERTFMTDPRRLRQILMNLLSNAIRYGEGSPVDMRCDLPGDRLVVEVEDRGPGIPADRLEQIFDEFVQLGSHQRGGTGLGLPIARALARQLGGDIAARSQEGSGSTFTLDLAEMSPAEPGAEEGA